MITNRLPQSEDVIQSLQRLADIFWIIVVHLFVAWLDGLPWRWESSNATLIAVFVFSVVAEMCDLYRGWRIEQPRVELRLTCLAWGMTVAALITLGFASKRSVEYSRVVSFSWFVAVPMVLCLWRVVVRGTLRVIRSQGRNIKEVAILGATASARELCSRIAERPWLGMRVIGVFDDRSSGRRADLSACSCPWAGDARSLIDRCRRNEIKNVYLALPLRAEGRIASILKELSDTTATVHLVADLFTYNLLQTHWSAIGGVPLLSVYDTPFQGLNRWLKRLEDIVGGLVILAFIAVPLLVIAALVKLTSPGPVFFRQRRYGLNGKEIRVLKFRTMTVCEDGPTIVQAKRDDARVTGLGRFLRRMSLDELPQFLQVLAGDMSIVGPRPHAVAHNESYRAVIKGYMLRHKVKPGITGWAQVNGWRGETPDVDWMRKRIEHDLEYIERWSLLWDLKIIFLTIAGRKKNQNAY